MHHNFLGRQADYVLEALTAPADYSLPPPRCVAKLIVGSSVVRYPQYLDTYRRYLCDDTSIAKVTIYRGIS